MQAFGGWRDNAAVNPRPKPAPRPLTEEDIERLQAMLDTARQLGLQTGQMEASLSLASHHLVLRAIAGYPGMALIVVLDRSAANLMVAQLSLQLLQPTDSAVPAPAH